MPRSQPSLAGVGVLILLLLSACGRRTISVQNAEELPNETAVLTATPTPFPNTPQATPTPLAQPERFQLVSSTPQQIFFRGVARVAFYNATSSSTRAYYVVPWACREVSLRHRSTTLNIRCYQDSCENEPGRSEQPLVAASAAILPAFSIYLTTASPVRIDGPSSQLYDVEFEGTCTL